ncbi:MAG: hypothetical protein HYU64_16930 [Armatimonadetes bacterium]|nr:hypothetical protein [Armatimonadota bacterium]
MIRSCLLTILFFLLSASFSQAESFEFRAFRVLHRPVTEVEPLVRAVVSTGGKLVIDSRTNQILVSDSPSVLGKVEKILKEFDITPTMVRVQVELVEREELVRRGIALTQVQYRSGIWGVSILGPGSFERKQRVRSFLTLMSDTEGQLAAGERIPYVTLSPWLGLYGVVSSGVAFVDATTGFLVLPRVTGDRIRLDLTPFAATPTGNSSIPVIRFSRAKATVELKSGEEVVLAGQDQETSRFLGALLGASRESAQSNLIIIVTAKVE